MSGDGSFSIRSLYSDSPTLAFSAPVAAPVVSAPSAASPSLFSSLFSPGDSQSSAAASGDSLWDKFGKPFSRGDSGGAVEMTPVGDFGQPAAAGDAPAPSSSSWIDRFTGRASDTSGDTAVAAATAAEPSSGGGSFWDRFTGKSGDDGASSAPADVDVEDDGSWLSRLGRNDSGNGGDDDMLAGIRQNIPWFRAFEDEEPDCWKKMTQALGLPSLSLKQRLYGFGVCWACGFVCAGLGSALIFNLRLFAILYTFANLFNLIGTFFLVGPVKQARSMFEPTRLVAAIVYLSSMAMTLVAALVFHNWVLAICMVAVQSCALIWYLASFIPYARTLIRRTLVAVWESASGA